MGKEFSITPRAVPRVETKYRRITTQLPHPDSVPTLEKLNSAKVSTHPPRNLLRLGSLRATSHSYLLTLEAERVLQHFGAETRSFDPHGLPTVDSVTLDDPKVQELRGLSAWFQRQVWCSPERRGVMTGIFKSSIDWLPSRNRQRIAME